MKIFSFYQFLFLIVVNFNLFSSEIRAIELMFKFPEEKNDYFSSTNYLQLYTVDGIDSISTDGLSENTIQEYLRKGYQKEFVFNGYIIVLYQNNGNYVWPNVYAVSRQPDSLQQKNGKQFERMLISSVNTTVIAPQKDETIVLIWYDRKSGNKKMFIPSKDQINIKLEQKSAAENSSKQRSFPIWTIGWPAFSELQPLTVDVAAFLYSELEKKRIIDEQYKPIRKK